MGIKGFVLDSGGNPMKDAAIKVAYFNGNQFVQIKHDVLTSEYTLKN